MSRARRTSTATEPVPGTPRAANARGDATPDDPLDDSPSKSQRKRDMHALQALGVRLVELPGDKLRRMDLPPGLLEAIELAQRITSREGRRRQLQYVGRLMRDVDAEAIRGQIELDGQQHRIDTAIMHAAERWRDVLVQAPDRLPEFVARYPAAAAGRDLSATLQAALAEVAREQRGRRFRDLFRALRDVMAESNDASGAPGGDRHAHPPADDRLTGR
jgi:ribosome-associated protein